MTADSASTYLGRRNRPTKLFTAAIGNKRKCPYLGSNFVHTPNKLIGIQPF
jgi:hypothetical protein